MDDTLSNWINTKGKKAVKPSLAVEVPKEWASKEWYYVDAERKAIGPVGFSKIEALYDEASITEETLVWYEGLPNWKKIEEIDGLF